MPGSHKAERSEHSGLPASWPSKICILGTLGILVHSCPPSFWRIRHLKNDRLNPTPEVK